MNTLRFVAFAVAIATLLPSCVAASKHYQVVDELARVQGELEQTAEKLDEAESVIVELDGGVDALEARANRADELAAERAQLEQQRAQLEQERQRLAQENQQLSSRVAELENAVADAQFSAPSGFEFIVDEAEGLYGYSGEGDVFFAPGRAELTSQGKKALGELARELANHDRPIRVVGHTDSDPVNKTKDLWPEGNVQLGAGRALSVMKYLVSQGLDEERFAIMSYGPYRPRDGGKDAGAKERNRRVEIMVEAL